MMGGDCPSGPITVRRWRCDYLKVTIVAPDRYSARANLACIFCKKAQGSNPCQGPVEFQ